MKKILDTLGNLKWTLLLGFFYAAVCGYATLIENDYGREMANVRVYYAWWFELTQFLLIVSMVINMFKFKMFRLKKLTTMAIHLGLALVLFGGALSHYFGTSGSLHLREGQMKDSFPIKDMSGKIVGTYHLPFQVKLTDFVLSRYPGNNAPSTYESFIEIYKDGKRLFPFHIYMNHILVHDGLRFYQASYDKDELGTILSVSKDPGMWPTYIGYFILFFGLLFNLFDPNSLFSRLRIQLRKIEQEKTTLLVSCFVLLFSFSLLAAPQYKIDKFHADKVLAALPVQTFRGRITPIDTVSEEVMNKISKKTSFEGYDHNQMLLSLALEPEYWSNRPMIYVHHPLIKEKLGVDKKVKRVAFNRFFKEDGSFLFKEDSDRAQKTAPGQRGTFEKELISLNERLNAFYMASKGQFFQALPDYQGEGNKWAPLFDGLSSGAPTEYQKVVKQYLFMVQNGDWFGADKRIKQIAAWQKQYSPTLVPTVDKIQWELLFNHWKIFQRLPLLMAPIGLFLLIFAFFSTLSAKSREDKLHGFSLYFSLFVMAFFIFGIGLRWYIAGRAPISDGYESMVFIGWATLLSGLIFFILQKNLLTLAISLLFSSLALGVAHLSWMDPQISSLVPVLKSYWLTIHVSVITASYGFLAVSACIGLVTLLLMLFAKEGERKTILTIKELTLINHMSIFVGLALLTIGTFLGGIWANESWGAYWSWDPKETWSWVSIILYAILVHLYYVKKWYSIFNFTVGSVVGLYSILMTYLGVNYYLAGLHSYAKGDPVPIPTWLYVMTIILFGIIALAYRKRKLFR